MANSCAWGGCVVGPAFVVPDEPTEFFHAGVYQVVGCSRLRCARCGELVRNGVGYWPDRQRFDADAAYDALDWDELPWMRGPAASPAFRLYLCRCTTHAEGSSRYVASHG